MLLISALLLSTLAPQGNERYPAIPEQDARSYDIDLQIDIAERTVTGRVDYVFTAVEKLPSVRLDALRSDDWQVAFLDPEGKPLAAEWHQDHVVVTLPEPVAKGQDARFAATLRGTPVDGLYFKQNRYGEWMAFTDHYSIRARGWLPCEDHPSDRAKFSLRLHCRDTYEVVAFGRRGLSESGKDWQRVQFASDQEIPPYMFALVVGPLARVAEQGDARLVDHFVYAQDVDKARQSLVNHARWIASMEEKFGPYPYSKYTTVQCPTRWGGFEAPGNVQLAETLFDAGPRGIGTLAHELAHMWFGDAVGYSAWREVWLSEGFASYFGPWLHAQTGGPTMKLSMAQMRARWLGSFEGRTKSIRDRRFKHPDQALNANTYPKGAWVLHMLRKEIGDEKFFAALRHYVDTCRSTSVDTRQFVACIEEVAETRLAWFFSQWLNRRGCPELKVYRDGDRWIVEQTQGEPYRFRLVLGWTDQDGVAQRKTIRMDERKQPVTLPADAQNVVLDPDIELLFRRAR